MYYIYKVLYFGFLLLLRRYILYSIKLFKLNLILELKKDIDSIVCKYEYGVHPSEWEENYDEDNEDDIPETMFLPLDIFVNYYCENKIYKNNSEYILLSEVFLYFLLYFLISYIITYSKFLIFKTEFFKGISILNIFNLYRLRASNISNINTGENNENTLDIKENIDIEPIIANNETNIGVHIHAENIIKQGIETVGKTIESGIAQAVPQIGLASAIGAGLSAGVKISAGQPLMARSHTYTNTYHLSP